jgi:hypothetical protein
MPEAAQGHPLTPVLIGELMDLLRCELGHHVLQSWKTAEPVCRVALRHHDAAPALDDPLLLQVQPTDAITRGPGTHLKPDPELNLLEVPAVEHLGLSELDLAALLVDAEDEFGQVRQLF